MTLQPFPVVGHRLGNALSVVYANRWFASLPLSHQDALLRAGHRVLLCDGQVLATQGQPARKGDAVFGVVLHGLMKVCSSSPDGRESILSFLWPGQWFGELALIDAMSQERDVLSVGSSEILLIEAEALQALLTDAAFCLHLARLLAARSRTLLSLVEGFTQRDSLARTARRLMLLAYNDELSGGSHRASLDVSQDALASMLGITRQSVASQLRQLYALGAIEQAYGRVHIRSMPALVAASA